jgi:hypothetical protein
MRRVLAALVPVRYCPGMARKRKMKPVQILRRIWHQCYLDPDSCPDAIREEVEEGVAFLVNFDGNSPGVYGRMLRDRIKQRTQSVTKWLKTQQQ